MLSAGTPVIDSCTLPHGGTGSPIEKWQEMRDARSGGGLLNLARDEQWVVGGALLFQPQAVHTATLVVTGTIHVTS